MMAYAIFSRSFTPALPVGVIHVMLPVDKVEIMLAFTEMICHAALVERIANPVRMILNKTLLSVQFPVLPRAVTLTAIGRARLFLAGA